MLIFTKLKLIFFITFFNFTLSVIGFFSIGFQNEARDIFKCLISIQEIFFKTKSCNSLFIIWEKLWIFQNFQGYNSEIMVPNIQTYFKGKKLLFREKSSEENTPSWQVRQPRFTTTL